MKPDTSILATMPRAANPPAVLERDFDHDARVALEGVRDAFAALLEAVPGEPPARAVDLGKALHLGTELRWQVFTVATSPDVLESGAHVPKAGSIESLLRAAERARMPRTVIRRVRAAYEQYERTVRAHAADRDTFNRMLQSLSADRANQVDEKLRRSLFQSQSVLWGLRQKVSYRCTIFRRDDRNGLTDGVNLMGSVELHQLRSGVPFSLGVTTDLRNYLKSPASDDLGSPEAPGEVSPLLILREFCSGPLPEEAVSAPYGPGGTQTRLCFHGLGRGAALNLALAQVVRNARSSVLEEFSGDVRVNTPSELLCKDMLVPAGLSDPSTADVTVYASRLNSEDVWNKRKEDRVAMRITPVYRGRVLVKSAGGAPERPIPDLGAVPRYPEVVARVLEDIGWSSMEFDLYRCRVEYPLLHSLTCLRVNALASAPGR